MNRISYSDAIYVLIHVLTKHNSEDISGANMTLNVSSIITYLVLQKHSRLH